MLPHATFRLPMKCCVGCVGCVWGARGEKGKTKKNKKVEMLAEYLENFIEEEVDKAGLNDLFYDLLANAIFEIDFTELAIAFLDV